MRVLLDNNSCHEVAVTVEGRIYNLHPKQIIYAEVCNFEPLCIKLEHKYVSYIDCRNDYIMVINTEYTLNGVTDGAVLSIAHDRSKFGFNGVYERFFVGFPLMFNFTENHIVTNFEDLYKGFRRKQRKKRFWDGISFALVDIVLSAVPLGILFVILCVAESLSFALAVLGVLFALELVGIFLIWLPIEVFSDGIYNRIMRKRRRGGKNEEEILMIDDLKGICESAAISAYYADPERTVFPEGSRYEG